MTLLDAALCSMVAAAASGVALARRRKEHRPAAVALVVLAVLAIAGEPLLRALPPAGADIPRRLWPLVYLDGARVLATVSVVPALALAVAGSRRGVAVVVGLWLAGSAALAALYPSPAVRGAELARLYLAGDLAGLFTAIAALAWWARLRRWPGSAHAVAIGLIVLDIATLVTPFSPWHGAIFGPDYDVTQVEMLSVFAVICAAQVILWRFSTL